MDHQVVLLCVVDAESESTPVQARGWPCLAPQCCTTPTPAILQFRNLGDIDFVNCDVTCDEVPIPKCTIRNYKIKAVQSTLPYVTIVRACRIMSASFLM